MDGPGHYQAAEENLRANRLTDALAHGLLAVVAVLVDVHQPDADLTRWTATFSSE